MKVDITSMFFNSKIEGQSATAAWATSIGHKKSEKCRIDDSRQGVIDIVKGMIYKSVSNFDVLDVSAGSSNREIITCSVFNDVFINGIKLENAQYTLLLVREHSQSHEGRLLISYAPYIKYDNVENQECVNLMFDALGCSSEGCWFVYDISVKNQSDLHFKAVVVNSSKPMIYPNTTTSKKRSAEWNALIPINKEIQSPFKEKKQIIYYGAPGTGKSKSIDDVVTKDNSIRTTFHPDSDYASFVGCYKPKAKDITDEGSEITYTFVPQAFTKAYIEAWKNTSKPYYLVIEEINRGNCAQIFGDLFQLLDRREDGFSSYEITPDTDLQQYLKKTFIEEDVIIDDVDIEEGKIMRLPSNLYILATMNTSDQSLFPIDSAFKRRWDWKYIPIKNEGKNHKIVVDKATYDWWEFIDLVNKRIESVTDSEDKQIGYWFAKTNDKNQISVETLVSKVLFYLWNDVFKDYTQNTNSLFKTDKRKYKFREFYNDNGDVKIDLLNEFLTELGLKNETPQSEETQPTEE